MSYGVVVGYFVSYEVVARHFANHGGELLISCVRRRRSKLRGCIVLHPAIQMAMLHAPEIDLHIGKVVVKHERPVSNLDPHRENVSCFQTVR